MADKQREMVTRLERVYAEALLELCDDAERAGTPGVLDEVANEIRQLAEWSRQHDDFVRLMSARTLSTNQRSEIIDRLLRGRVNDLLYRFLQVVNEKDRLDCFEGMARALSMLLEERRGIVEVDAYVPATLSPVHAGRLADKIGAAIEKQVELTQHEMPELIGGLKLRIGDQLIDGSVAAQLRMIRQKMIETGRNRARLGGQA